MTAFAIRPGQALPVGAPVRVRKHPPETHCRTPFYLRGIEGEITDVMGCFRDPSLLAFHKPGLPLRVLYRVRFKQADVWPNYSGSPKDTVVADIYDHWIEPLAGEKA
jgi:hypothetical protein